jgi:outer membrane lipoprotein LolB
MTKNSKLRRSREGGNLSFLTVAWVPACAGTTRFLECTPFLGALIFALLATACTSVPERKPAPIGEIGKPTQALKALQLNGRLSIKQGGDAQVGNLRWFHDAPHHEIAVLSPIGSTVANIVQDGDKVSLTMSDKKKYEAADADQLMENVLGWRLPLNGMQYWVLGRAAPPVGNARTELGPDNRVAKLTQQNWRIEYANYRPVGDTELPGRIVMRRDDIEIRFVVDSAVPVPSTR